MCNIYQNMGNGLSRLLFTTDSILIASMICSKSKFALWFTDFRGRKYTFNTVDNCTQ